MRLLALASAATFVCTPVAVWDGDGSIWFKEGPKIRIAGIAAREMDGTCSRGHPCPAASAVAARDALIRLLGGRKGQRDTGHIIVRAPAMRCSANGQSYGRVVASCRLSYGRDLAKAMLATRTVQPWR